MNPRRFLDLAHILKGGQASPEFYRSAINRAYYAAYNVGIDTLITVGIDLGDGSTAHGQLRNVLGYPDDSGLNDARDLLTILSRRRRAADYEMNNTVPETRREADDACREARKVIEILDAFLVATNRDALVSLMKSKARTIPGITVK